MKKCLLSILLTLPVFSYAAVTSNQMGTCFYSDLVMSNIMKDQGNAKVAKDYESTALFWAEEGNKRFGQSNFEKAWKAASTEVKKMSVDQLVATKKKCLQLMPETLK